MISIKFDCFNERRGERVHGESKNHVFLTISKVQYSDFLSKAFPKSMAMTLVALTADRIVSLVSSSAFPSI